MGIAIENNPTLNQQLISESQLPACETTHAVASNALRNRSAAIQAHKNFAAKPISHLDVIQVVFSLMKLAIDSRSQERFSRRQEREAQLDCLHKLIENFQKQGNSLFLANFSSGLFGFAAGVIPAAGYFEGKRILKGLNRIYPKFDENMTNEQIHSMFKGFARTMHTSSEVARETGKIHNTFSDGERTLLEHKSDFHRRDGEENTRTMEEILQNFRSLENMIQDLLQKQSECIRQLYN